MARWPTVIEVSFVVSTNAKTRETKLVEGGQMSDEEGVPVRDLTDEELERQGLQAHTKRHWVFLHGTAEQFHTHTQRMFELEEEYLRRHPQRTWQGAGGGEDRPIAAVRDARIRDLIQTLTGEVLNLLDEQAPATARTGDEASDHERSTVELLTAFSVAKGGRLHKLEVHQIARSVALNARLVAMLYKQDPPLLRAEGDDRIITDEGRAWLAAAVADGSEQSRS
jgi:hypothetical protein